MFSVPAARMIIVLRVLASPEVLASVMSAPMLAVPPLMVNVPFAGLVSWAVLVRFARKNSRRHVENAGRCAVVPKVKLPTAPLGAVPLAFTASWSEAH
jgi:hypothetical protein